MPRTICCWRCRMALPMLSEDEWRELAPHLRTRAQIKAYRDLHPCSLAEANAKGFGQEESQCVASSPAHHLRTTLPRMREAASNPTGKVLRNVQHRAAPFGEHCWLSRRYALRQCAVQPFAPADRLRRPLSLHFRALMTDSLLSSLKAVNDEASFMNFARALLADRQVADGAPSSLDGFQGEWANNSISAFIEGAISWAEDSEFGVRPGPKASNPWALFATFLWAGRGYE